MTEAIWVLLTLLAQLTQGYGSEVGVLDHAGRPTVLLCEATACIEFRLEGGAIVVTTE